MSMICDISGVGKTIGGSITRRGLAKKKGGIGMHVVKNVKRTFVPNLQKHRLFVPELNCWVTLRISARVLRSIQKNGVYKVLKDAKRKGTLQKQIPGI